MFQVANGLLVVPLGNAEGGVGFKLLKGLGLSHRICEDLPGPFHRWLIQVARIALQHLGSIFQGRTRIGLPQVPDPGLPGKHHAAQQHSRQDKGQNPPACAVSKGKPLRFFRCLYTQCFHGHHTRRV